MNSDKSLVSSNNLDFVRPLTVTNVITSPLSWSRLFTVTITLKISCFSLTSLFCPSTSLFLRKNIADDSSTATIAVAKINPNKNIAVREHDVLY
jgi:hypothetical protein